MKKLSIHLKEVNIHFSGKPILEIDELFVYENEKIGIIGKNGAGKSTLLNLIMGKIQSDKGKVQRLNDFHYLAQVAEEITNESEKTDKNCLLNQKNPSHRHVVLRSRVLLRSSIIRFCLHLQIH